MKQDKPPLLLTPIPRMTSKERIVRRLQFWILQITGALDMEEDPNNVSFPNVEN